MDTVLENILAILIAGVWLFGAIHSRNKARRERNDGESAPASAKPTLRPYPLQKQKMERRDAVQTPDAGQYGRRESTDTERPMADRAEHRAENPGDGRHIQDRRAEVASPDTKHENRGPKKPQRTDDDILEDFDLRKAVIYSEILNPKFREEE